jgi:hypothetical protein
MRHPTHHAAAMPTPELDWEIDAEIFEEPFETSALQILEASLEDVEPWQRLGDLLGRITGEADAE